MPGAPSRRVSPRTAADTPRLHQALGAKKAVLAAPTYHFYRAGELLTSMSGAMPHRLIELLDEHKGKAAAKRGGTKLLALLGMLLAGGAVLAWSNSQSSPAKKAPAPPIEAAVAAQPPPERADENATQPAAEGEPAHELPAAPAQKAASSPSAGARLER